MLRPWTTHFLLDNSKGSSIHAKLCNQLINEIQVGRLKPGDILPGSRSLASQLAVNRKTVQLAYEELESQGWLESRPRSGTYVSNQLPEQALSNENLSLVSANIAQDTKSSSALLSSVYESTLVYQDGSIEANDGVPDPRLIPYGTLSKAYRRAIVRSSHQASLGYGDPRGVIELRESIKDMLIKDRFMNVGTDNVCIVRGSQMGIFLASRVLNPEKGVIVFEKLCYSPAVAAFESNGFKIVFCEIDEQGLKIDCLRNILKSNQVSGIFVTPHHQYPTTVCLPMDRRLILLSLSKTHNFVVIEDDYDHDFHYDMRPIPPLSSLPNSENVVHIGSMSKVFAPSLRLGYLIANKEFIDRIVHEIVLIDRQGNAVSELALADLMESGEVKKHIRRVRRLYKIRRDHTAKEITRFFGDMIKFTLPIGGLALWLDVSRLITKQAVERLSQPGGFFVNSYICNKDEPQNIRFGFGALNEKEITKAVEKLHALFN